MKKVSAYALTAIGVMTLGLLSPNEASAGDLRLTVHFGIPVIVQPAPVIYRPMIPHQSVRHVRRPHRHHHRHRHLHAPGGWPATAQPMVSIGVHARLR